MAFELLDLHTGIEALEPHISAETLEYHHGKHHNAYVDQLNELIASIKLADASLEKILNTVQPPRVLRTMDSRARMNRLVIDFIFIPLLLLSNRTIFLQP